MRLTKVILFPCLVIWVDMMGFTCQEHLRAEAPKAASESSCRGAHKHGAKATKVVSAKQSAREKQHESLAAQTEPRITAPKLTSSSNRHLRSFYQKLLALKQGHISRVRISLWGDSHIAAEAFPARLRQSFQTTFGDGGPGFVLVGRPWRSYRHSEVKQVEGRWSSERLWTFYSRRRPRPRDDLLGIAGISVHASRASFVTIIPKHQHPLKSMDLHYLGQPRGGRINIRQGGHLLLSLTTRAKTKSIAFARIDLLDPRAPIELTTKRGEVRLSGIDLAAATPGVVFDSLGLNGATASSMLLWNEEVMQKQLERLAPDLVMLAYGSNEIDADSLTRESFADAFDTVLKRMKKLAPQAACLVIGPSDQARFVKGSGWELPARLDFMIEEEERLADANGCAFWDQRAAMGGRGSIFTFLKARPLLAKSDHLHFMPEGYYRLSDALYQSMTQGFLGYVCETAPDSCARLKKTLHEKE